jgi:hypothetical protein
MNKRILDYGYVSIRILQPFYSLPDTRDNANGIYDIIVCERDSFQDNLDDMLQYAHKDTKILIDIISESGNLDNFIDIFLELTNKHKDVQFYLLVDSVFDVNVGSNVKMLQSYKLSFLPFFENYCVEQHDSQFVLNDTSIYNKRDGFLSLNGSMRTQRILLLIELIKNGYVNLDGTISNINNNISFLFYGNNKFDIESYNIFIDNMLLNGEITNEEFVLLNSISNSLPIIVNGEMGERPDLLLREYYANILNLVTDNATGFDDSDNFKYGTITLTEKAWKPFKTHQLPLYIGLPGYVDVIRNLGFDVFDDFINHNYDKEQNHIERIKIVVEELNKLTQLDMLEFYNQNRKRFVKNCANIYKLKSEAYLELHNFIIQNDLI